MYLRGLGWLLWRIKQELFNPKLKFFESPINTFFTIKAKIFGHNKSLDSDLIYGIYDLEVCPVTFNIIEFLCELEIYTNNKNKPGFTIVIVPAKLRKNYYESEYEKAVDKISSDWRVNNILVQTAQLHPMCRGIFLLPSRRDIKLFLENFEIFPELYSNLTLRGYDTRKFYSCAIKPGSFSGLRAHEQGRRYISSYIKKQNITKSIVTIVIRQYDYDPARNSRLHEWARFVIYLESQNFHPIVIPDTDNAFSDDLPFNKRNIFSDCCWNVQLRMALYEMSFLNFSVLNGAGAIMLFNPLCRCIFMNTRPVGSITTTDKTVSAASGYRAGEKWKFLTENQIFSTAEDSFENIKEEFEKYLKKIK